MVYHEARIGLPGSIVVFLCLDSCQTNHSIGQSWMRADPLAEATGQAVYVDDMILPDMLYDKSQEGPMPMPHYKSNKTCKEKELFTYEDFLGREVLSSEAVWCKRRWGIYSFSGGFGTM